MQKLPCRRRPLAGIFLHLGILCLLAVTTTGATYYVSSSKGNDANDGSIEAPFQSLAKLSATSLQPGETVLFRRGDRFDGHLVLNDSGSAPEPITLSAYGYGDHPIITGEVGAAGGGDYQEAILVENADNYVFDGLEINNERNTSRPGVDDKDAYGIQILNSGSAVLRNFTFRNLILRNVYAARPVLPEEGQDAFNGIEVSGIRLFTTQNTASKLANIRDVLIEDCFFTDLQRLGVHIKHGGGRGGAGDETTNTNRDIVVRNNIFQHTGGTCVLPIRTYNCLIAHNLFYRPGSDQDPRMPNRGSSVWTWRCINTVIQYNHCISIRGYLDSHGIHIDHENRDTFVQYNYMEDCEGGFVEILGGNVNSVYRFNVSVNDGWRENPGWRNSNHTFWINEKVPSGDHHSEYNYIYNNTIHMDRDFTTAIDMDSKHTFIYNNILNAADGNIGGKQVVVRNNGTALFMKNNLFNGTIDNRFKFLDTAPVTGDPAFSDSGAGKPYGFQLDAQSAAIDAGVAQLGPPIPGAGTGIFSHLTAYPTVDFYGNPVDLSTGTPNIGASNAKDGSVVAAPPIAVKQVYLPTTQLSLSIDDSAQLTALVIPANADDVSITWSSDNPAAATVDATGMVTVHSPGSALITATSANGLQDTCYVNLPSGDTAHAVPFRHWLQEKGFNPDTTAPNDLSAAGSPLFLQYALGDSLEEPVVLDLALIDDQLHGRIQAQRPDVYYQSLVSRDLALWSTAPLPEPDAVGMRTLATETSGDAPVFVQIGASPQ